MKTGITITNIYVRVIDDQHKMIFASIRDYDHKKHFAIAEWVDETNHIDKEYCNTLESSLVTAYDCVDLGKIFTLLDKWLEEH